MYSQEFNSVYRLVLYNIKKVWVCSRTRIYFIIVKVLYCELRASMQKKVLNVYVDINLLHEDLHQVSILACIVLYAIKDTWEFFNHLRNQSFGWIKRTNIKPWVKIVHAKHKGIHQMNIWFLHRSVLLHCITLLYFSSYLCKIQGKK